MDRHFGIQRLGIEANHRPDPLRLPFSQCGRRTVYVSPGMSIRASLALIAASLATFPALPR